jgi:hypothetical protein
MRLILRDGLPFASVAVSYREQEVEVSDVVVDTGSVSTILAADAVENLGIVPAPNDSLYSVRGVGGSEVVFSRVVNRLRVGERTVEDFEVEIGGMDYGFPIGGILGMDFLLQAGATIDLERLVIEFADRARNASHAGA